MSRLISGVELALEQKHEVARIKFLEQVKRGYIQYQLEILSICSKETPFELMQNMTVGELENTIKLAGIYVPGLIIRDLNPQERSKFSFMDRGGVVKF